MQSFRRKPSTSCENLRRSSKTPDPNSEQYFPFRNRRLKVQAWQDDLLQVKHFKGGTQIIRKKCQFIPLLKSSNMGRQTISVVKGSRNEYNIFLDKSQNKQTLAQSIDVINGIRRTSSPTKLFQNQKLLGYSSLGFKQSYQNSLFTTNISRIHNVTNSGWSAAVLSISGQTKCLSASRSAGRQKSSTIDQKIIKI